MKRIKKVISLILCFCMMFGFTLEAFAACVTPSADKTSVAAGENITVTLTLDENIDNCFSFEYYLYYDANKFELTASKAGNSISGLQVSAENDSDTEGTYYKINWLDPSSNGATIKAGTLCELTFTAKKDISDNDEVTFRAKRKQVGDSTTWGDKDADAVTTGDPVSVTVTPAPVAASYKVDLEGTQTVQLGETAPVTVKIASDNATTYNTVDVMLSYDKDKLELVTTSLGDGYTIKKDTANGTVRVAGYGTDKQLGDAFTLNFKAQKLGAAEVAFVAAKVDEATHATTDDAPDATIVTDKVTITVGGYTVNLQDDFEGAGTATPDADYTFTAKDTHYDYDVKAKIGDTELTVTDNGDGSFTISKDQITGNITVTATKTAKQYDVTVTGTGAADVTAPAKATYKEDYKYTFVQDSKYDYTVKIAVDGTEISPVLVEGTADQYQIDGSKITGPMTIEVNKTLKPVTASNILFTGDGAADVAGGTSQTAPINQEFKFTITKEDGYVYTITAVKGETEKTDVTVTDNGDGTYTIPAAAIDGTNITVNVAKEAEAARTADVYKYVELDGKVMYLVVAKDSSLADGKVLTYDGSAMYWSEKYEGYCWLVISDQGPDAVKEAAADLIGDAEGTRTEISYTGDVNKTEQADINDAQLVYDMYNAKYDGFDTVSVEKFLRADMNGSKNLTVEDARAVVSEILK